MSDLFLCGDIHGELETAVYRASELYGLQDCDIIFLGDFGVGFSKKSYLECLYNKVKNRLINRNLRLWVLRGNHDDPSYFDGSVEFPRLKFIKDYEILSLGGHEILPIGGASSTDITWRLKENYRRKSAGSSRRIWWPEECIKEIPIKDIPRTPDVVLSHTAPIVFDPIISRFPETPEEQYQKILRERNYLKEVFDHVRPDYWIYGHFHQPWSGHYDNSYWRCLDIHEFYKLPKYTNNFIQGEEKYEG